jgi:hypothetical protein
MDKEEEHQKVKINLNGEFTAPELEDIIAELGKARAGMLPAVSKEPPSVESNVDVTVQEETLYSIRTLVSGGVRIWLRNEGFGWLGFTLTPADKEGIRDFLGKKIGHSHTSH